MNLLREPIKLTGLNRFSLIPKRRHEKFYGLTNKTFNLHLKECEIRFNNRDKNIYLLLLKEFKNNPLI